MSEEKGFTLDESAQRLYQQLEGIDDTLRADVSYRLESELMHFLQQEEKKRDRVRLLITQITCLFVDILNETKNPEPGKRDNRKTRVLLNLLQKAGLLAGKDSRLVCRFRGQQTIQESSGLLPADPEAYDYELSIGDILLDCQVALKVEQREKIDGRGLPERLLQAFSSLSGMRIFNFSMDIKAEADGEDLRKFDLAIRSLIRFYHPGDNGAGFFVLDEYGQPNVNLTLLAATNNVRPSSLQDLVAKIKPRLLGPEAATELGRFATVYDVILATRRYQEQLPKMAIEVNNVQQLVLAGRLNAKRTVEAIQVSRLVLAKYSADPKKASEIISSISQEGYRGVHGRIMGNRLAMASEFLELAEGSENREKLQQEALQNIEEGLENIPDEVYSELSIEGDNVSSVDGQGRKTRWAIHRKIFGLVRYFKQRALTKSKVRDISNKSVEFDAVDFSVIARNCKVTEGEAAHLVVLLKDCFSENGRFRRSSFERNIPEFLRYEEKVFEFLWYYLKELTIKGDRIAFLNSIQILVSQLNKPQGALNILLTDIFNPTSTGRFSDRNGLILANILLRTYNQEEKSNVELTPEEVLFVWEGLNKDMVTLGLKFFRDNRELVVMKVKRLTELLLQLSIKRAHQEEQMKLRFLVSLMREMVVFCSLIGGKISLSTVRGVVQEFGNPFSNYYRKIEDKEQISQGLKLLQVAARGLKRFNDPVSTHLLEKIAGRERDFVELYDNHGHRVTVKNVLGRVVKPDG